MVSITAMLSYICEICLDTFCSTDDLKLHLLSSHYGALSTEAEINTESESVLGLGFEPETFTEEEDPLRLDVKTEVEEPPSQCSLARPLRSGTLLKSSSFLEVHAREAHQEETYHTRANQAQQAPTTEGQSSFVQLKQEPDSDQDSIGHRGSDVTISSKVLADSKRLPKPGLKKDGRRSQSPFRAKTRGGPDKRRYYCGICNKAMPGSDRAAHMKDFHFGLSCTVCNKDFENWTFLNIHAMTFHRNEKIFSCSVCDRTFATTKNVREHLVKIHKINFIIGANEGKKDIPSFCCPMCDKEFRHKRGLTVHIADTHDDGYKCNKCGQPFSSLGLRSRHVREVHKSVRKSDSSQACSKKLRPSTRPLRRVRQKQLQRYECTRCSESFSGDESLGHHTRQVHLEGVFSFDGSVSGEVLPKKAQGEQHDKVAHSNQKNIPKGRTSSSLSKLKCSFCDTKFFSKNQRQLHIVSKHGVASMSSEPEDYDDDWTNAAEAGTGLTNSDASVQDNPEAEYILKVEEDNLDSDALVECSELGEPLNHDVKKEVLELDFDDGNMPSREVHLQESNREPEKNVQTKDPLASRLQPENAIEKLKKPSRSYRTAETTKQQRKSGTLASKFKRSSMSTPTNAEALSAAKELFVFTTEHAKLKMALETFTEFKKTLASQLASAVWLKSVGPNINCNSVTYNSDDCCAVISCNNQDSTEWFKDTISRIQLGGHRFRAWRKGEMPKVTRMSLSLPDTFDRLNHPDIEAAVSHFNADSCDLFSVRCEKAQTSGRVFEVDVGPLLHQFCLGNNWSLNFLMGSVECKPMSSYETIPGSKPLQASGKTTIEINCFSE